MVSGAWQKSGCFCVARRYRLTFDLLLLGGIAYLEKKIQTKDDVLAELMAEHVALKKTLGEL
jgi:hypothetical protein